MSNPWIWDGNRHEYYYYSSQEHAYIYHNGARIPVASTTKPMVLQLAEIVRPDASEEGRNTTSSYNHDNCQNQPQAYAESSTGITDGFALIQQSDHDDIPDTHNLVSHQQGSIAKRPDPENERKEEEDSDSSDDDVETSAQRFVRPITMFTPASNSEKRAWARFDTGCDVNVITKKKLKEWKVYIKIKSYEGHGRFVQVDGTELVIQGTVRLRWYLTSGEPHREKFYVVDDMFYDVLIGAKNTWESLKHFIPPPTKNVGVLTFIKSETKKEREERERKKTEADKIAEEARNKEIIEELSKPQ